MTNAICQGLEDGGVEHSYKQTKSLLAKYIQRIDEQMPRAAQSYQKKQDDGEVVVLTGSTGSLGALILQDLLQSSSVRKVYALVRGKNGMDRLHKSFEERSLDTSLLQSGKLQAYPLDQTQAQLGLTPEQYKNMQAEATMICHCAWMLDFLQPVAYYEKECLGGLFNLLMLAYRNGDRAMRFHFISSVSASMAMKGEVSEVPLPDEPTCAAPMGYAQSKFIAEHLMRHVADTKSKHFMVSECERD
jgi:thioester reductase-like protein